MATIKSSKPGEIGGSSALTGRTPSYRLVLKVDPKTGQYKYEYEVDDAPKVADIVPPKTGDNVFGKITIPKIDFKEKKLPDEDSFEQTKKALAAGGRGPASGESGMPVGGGAQGTGKGLGFGFSGGTGTYSRGTPGSDTFTPGPGIGKAYDEYGRLRDIGKIKDIGLNVVDATGKVVSAAKDYVTSGGILGAAKGLIEGITNNKQKTPTTGTSFDDKAVSRGTFEQTKEALGGTADLGSTASVFSDLDPARKNIDDQIAELKEQAKSFTAPRTFIANKIKELEEQKSKLDPTGQVKSTDTRRPDAIGLPDKTKVADNTATISNARQGLENAIRSNNIGAAVDAAKTVAGFSGLSRDKAQAAMDQASIDASKYAAKSTGTEKRDLENQGRKEDGTAEPGSIAEARDKVGEQEAEKSRTVDRTSAVDNKARSNEVSDKNGNAVTDKKGNAVNFGGGKGDKNKDSKDKDKGGSKGDGGNNKSNKSTKSKDTDKSGGIGDAQKKSGGSTGGGGGGKGRVICTELYRQGLMPKEDWRLDLWYTQNYLSRKHIIGYWYYAIPMVKIMRKNKLVTNIWKHIAINRTQDIKWRLDTGKFNLLGRIYSIALETIANILGHFVEEKDYKILYKGEV